MSGETILIVDDEAAFLRVAGGFLSREGYNVVTAMDGAAARKAYDNSRPDLVLLDLVMPPEQTPEAGLSLLPDFTAAPVIVMTAHNEYDYALRATSAGAWDFLAKPLEPDLLRFAVERALTKAALEREITRLKAERNESDDGLIGASPAIMRLKELIRRIGAAELPVMVLGPTGSGKELVAKALHRSSPRRDKPLISIHCGAIPAELIESELFGHLKGSFTGLIRIARDLSPPRMAARYFLMKSAKCRCRCKSSYCASCRKEPTRLLARVKRDERTCVSSARRIVTLKP